MSSSRRRRRRWRRSGDFRIGITSHTVTVDIIQYRLIKDNFYKWRLIRHDGSLATTKRRILPDMVVIVVTGAGVVSVLASFFSLIVLSKSPSNSTSNYSFNTKFSCGRERGRRLLLINHLFQKVGESNRIDPFEELSVLGRWWKVQAELMSLSFSWPMAVYFHCLDLVAWHRELAVYHHPQSWWLQIFYNTCGDI